jgi:hypothetical protein
VMSSAAGLWKLFRDQAERGSGIGLKLFGFIAESVFTFIPESCSCSSWNGVRNHPGIAFTFARIPHQSETTYKTGQMFYEPPGSTHQVSRNASETEPAKLLAMIFAKKGLPLVTPA